MGISGITEKVFISGTAGFGTTAIKELPVPVKELLNETMMFGDEILVGDCQGVDTLVQEYLKEHNYKNVTVYCSGSFCRNCLCNDWHINYVGVPSNVRLETMRGRAFYELKDKAMAKDADRGIAVWDGKSQGTGNNIKNLIASDKHVLVYRTDLNRLEQHSIKEVNLPKGYFEERE